MAETRGRSGLGALWLLMSIMVFVGGLAMAWAFLFPDGIDLIREAETATIQEPIAVEEEAVTVELVDVVADPSSYVGKDLVAIVRVNEILNSRSLWIGSREDAGQELFAVVASGIDLSAMSFRPWQLIKIYATVRPLQDEELKSQGVEIGTRIAYTLQSEKSFILIKGLIPQEIQPWLDFSPTPTAVADEVTEVDELPVEYQEFNEFLWPGPYLDPFAAEESGWE